eukprot:CAMPEP_0198672582 /NCGR_PEP_ID=MMETSP1467-20131203/91740_1 /TAXON_ID=1462469 /ORGANISM="unid. sp., Strain CCMP2135" /LENGTH=39 /DNA_ID= /DNA_START= /DNA_END= /DNA_ORIENTATION=
MTRPPDFGWRPNRYEETSHTPPPTLTSSETNSLTWRIVA